MITDSEMVKDITEAIIEMLQVGGNITVQVEKKESVLLSCNTVETDIYTITTAGNTYQYYVSGSRVSFVYYACKIHVCRIEDALAYSLKLALTSFVDRQSTQILQSLLRSIK